MDRTFHVLLDTLADYIKDIMNNIKRKEFVDELEIYLNNFEIDVKNCDRLAVRTALLA